MRSAVLLSLLALTACVAPPPPAVPAPAPAAERVPPPAPPPTQAWTREPGATIGTDGGTVILPYLFMRVEVLRTDSAAWMVRCVPCVGQPIGWMDPAALVHGAPPVADAAALDLADFALALREAAARRDTEALRAGMARDFVHSLAPTDGGILEALAAWEREGFRSLDRMPFLLDRGIAAVSRSPVWVAPPEFASERGYADLRVGFRRGPDGWEWIFLVRSGE
jgi:hypothetical protein